MSAHLDDGINPKADVGHLDAGDSHPAKLEYGATESAYVSGSIEEKRLVRKIDVRMLPILWIMVSVHLSVGNDLTHDT